MTATWPPRVILRSLSSFAAHSDREHILTELTMLSIATAALSFSGPAALASQTRATVSMLGPDSRPTVIGLAQKSWPNVYDGTASLGGFSHSNMEAPREPPQNIPVDSVPSLIGLGQKQWPSEYDRSSTLGGFTHTNNAMPVQAAATAPVDSVPQLIGLAQKSWPSEYDRKATIGSFCNTDLATQEMTGSVVPTAAVEAPAPAPAPEPVAAE